MYWQKDTEDEVRDVIRSNLHLQGKVIYMQFLNLIFLPLNSFVGAV